MLVFYHRSDYDGKCSAAIVLKKYPDCRLIGVSHGAPGVLFFDKNPPSVNMTFKNEAGETEEVLPGEKVFVVDYSFSEAEMVCLDLFAKLTWIDHHKSAIEALENYSFYGHRSPRLAACELTWQFLFPEDEMPEAVRLLGAYDSWRHHGHEDEDEFKNVLPFQYGLRERSAMRPNDDLWESLLDLPSGDIMLIDALLVEDICTVGNTILNYVDQTNAKIANSMAFEGDFHGYRAIAINQPWANSKAFDAVYDPDKHDIMILFATKGDGMFKHTLFCDKEGIDVSALAKKYPGGGGHAGAAGFITDSIEVTAKSSSLKKVA